MTLPVMPEGMTADWLTSKLKAAGWLPAGAVAAISRELVGDGTGMMSNLSRLRVTYEGDSNDLPDAFVVKYPSDNPTNREIAMSFHLYEREVRYFAELDIRTSAYSPRTYLSELSGDNFIILMEDLSAYQVGDQAAGADLDQTERAIDELAKLHATFWDVRADLEWVPGIAESYHADNMAALIGVGWPVMCDLFEAFVPAEIAHRGQDIVAAIRSLQASMMRAPVTLLHGDFRMENLLFGTRPDHHRIAIIDWQGPLIGRGMVDVALFLGQSTRTEVRREHESALIQRYVRGLKSAGVKDYTAERAWQEYQAAILYNWIYTGVVAGTLDVHNEKAFTWMSQMVMRQSDATLDLDVFRLL